MGWMLGYKRLWRKNGIGLLCRKSIRRIAMLEQTFREIYTKFKLNFYKNIFHTMDQSNNRLSATEAFSVEVIYAMKGPTIREFADFVNISQPNATYKINSLVRKGYINKVNSASDKREYHLEVTQKFLDYYRINDSYIHEVMENIRRRFAPEDVKRLEEILRVIADELM